MDMSYKRAWDLVDEINRICRHAAVERQTGGMVKLRSEDIADAVLYMVTRDRRVAVNQMLVRAAEQTW